MRGDVSGENLTEILDLQVPRDGRWRLRLWLKDGADNTDENRAATLQDLRLDTQPPDAAFVRPDPDDPSRIPLRATDETSGVSGVEIEARRRGETVWRTLPVDGAPERFAAVVDDEQLPAGTYELRARVRDQAGNERTTTLLDGGRPMEIVLPLRAATSLKVGRSVRVRVGESRGSRPRFRRELVTSFEAGFGRRVALGGRITDAEGHGRARAPIEVLERIDVPGAGWRPLTTLVSTASGVVAFRAEPGPNRVLRFRYPGTATTRPAVADVELRTRAGVTLVPSRNSLHNGEPVVFRGRLLGAPLPPEGKLLALQAHTTRGWRTFATPRARGRDGRWSFRYRFTGTTATARYAFRVVVPREASYPYLKGSSRVAHVLVLGG